jgi:hypothetical protein
LVFTLASPPGHHTHEFLPGSFAVSHVVSQTPDTWPGSAKVEHIWLFIIYVYIYSPFSAKWGNILAQVFGFLKRKNESKIPGPREFMFFMILIQLKF